MDDKTKEGICAALRKLDPENDDHWTKGGLPLMKPVEAAFGSDKITRHDINEAMPNYSRDMARAIASAPAPAATTSEPEGGNDPDPEDEGGSEGVPGEGEVVTAAVLQPARIVEVPVKPKTVGELIDAVEGDAILLIEAFTLAASNDRFKRNNELMTLARGYMASQRSIKDHQARLDARAAARSERNGRT